MFASTILTISFLLASPALVTSIPHHLARGLGSRHLFARDSGHRCDVSDAVLTVPPNQNALIKPTIPPSFIGLGVGTQNYTCSAATSKYTSTGAVAELFDMSCLNGKRDFTTIQDKAYKAWLHASPSTTPTQIVNTLSALKHPIDLGQHYFITNPISGVGLSPKWDFTSASFAGNPDAFVVAAKVGDIPAPSGPADVDWLSLKQVQGELATQVFRIFTKGGQPPASCTPGDAPITVKYTSQYWFYGSSV
jgi:hypothetical protein